MFNKGFVCISSGFSVKTASIKANRIIQSDVDEWISAKGHGKGGKRETRRRNFYSEMELLTDLISHSICPLLVLCCDWRVATSVTFL